jgi:hypothetical protein
VLSQGVGIVGCRGVSASSLATARSAAVRCVPLRSLPLLRQHVAAAVRVLSTNTNTSETTPPKKGNSQTC